MEIEYKIRTDENGEPVACDSCGCEAPTANFQWEPPFHEQHDSQERALCEFCATTLAGNYTRYPAREDATMLRAEIWKAAACVFNMLTKKPC